TIGCGDGTLDAGEQCDDGNAIDGDGCSADCRLECRAAADCDDADPCTRDTCGHGACSHAPATGLDAVACTLDGLLHLPACDATPPPARLRLAQRVDRVSRLVARATAVDHRRVRRRLLRC